VKFHVIVSKNSKIKTKQFLAAVSTYLLSSPTT